MATKLADAYVQIIPVAQGIGGAIQKELSAEAGNAGQSAGLSIASKIKGAIAAAGIGTAIVGTVKAALDEGGKLQQSFGGLDTLYGDAAGEAKNFAYEAAKAGISANDYAEQAVSFGAGLKQAFGGDSKKAVKAANTAIMDMADNAAKMGTPIENIQNAYQGFAKSNYTMLDNLKLGYGGTKTEMERLLKDAEAFSGVHYDISNLGDVYEAIHVVQEELGLAGVAAGEAEGTFTGSMGAMKASASNLLANMALGENIKPQLTTLATSTKNFLLNNLLPMIGNVIRSIPTLFSTIFQLAVSAITSINWLEAGQNLINKIHEGITGLSETIPTKMEEIATSAKEWFEGIDWNAVGQGIITLIKGGISLLTNDIPNLILSIGRTALGWLKGIDWLTLGSNIIEFIGNGITFLINNIPDLLKSIGENAVAYFKAVSWLLLGQDVINFIINGITNLVTNIPTKIKEIGEDAVLKMQAVNWRQLGSDVITFIVNGIIDLVTSIPTKIKEIGEQAVLWLKAISWRSTGKNVIEFIVNGLKDLATSIPDKIVEFGKDAVEKVKEIDWLQLGKDIINGIVDGIKAVPGVLADAVKGAAQSALDAAKDFLGIKSPSKVFRDEVGKWMALGIGVGFEKYMPITEMQKKLAESTNGVMATVTPTITASSNVSASVRQETTLDDVVTRILEGNREIANGVERGISNIKMVANNRETGRFIADLGFSR